MRMPGAMIHWPEILETGYPEIDDQHRRLVAACNRLTALADARGAWSEIVATSTGLAQDFSEHFDAEESLLERTRFSRVDAHKAQHQRLRERIEALNAYLSGVDGSKPEHWNAIATIRDTLVDVLFRHDLDYKSHLEQAAGR
jgi:hemerythrin